MNIPEKYFGNLPPSVRTVQAKLIQKSKDIYEKTGKVVDRPKVSDQPNKRSKHAKNFEDKYGFSVSDIARVKKVFSDTDVDTILSKGRGAYASSGSRPNTTSEAWSKARLASALTGGNAYKIDKSHIGEKSKRLIFS